MPKSLQQTTRAAPEHVKIARVRITLQRLLHLQCQAVHAATHVGVAVGQPDPHARGSAVITGAQRP